jgi:hypothetical protein
MTKSKRWAPARSEGKVYGALAACFRLIDHFHNCIAVWTFGGGNLHFIALAKPEEGAAERGENGDAIRLIAESMGEDQRGHDFLSVQEIPQADGGVHGDDVGRDLPGFDGGSLFEAVPEIIQGGVGSARTEGRTTDEVTEALEIELRHVD